MHCSWENEDYANQDDNGLALVIHCFQRFGEEDVQRDPQIDEPATSEEDGRCFVVVRQVFEIHFAEVNAADDVDCNYQPMQSLLVQKVANDSD